MLVKLAGAACLAAWAISVAGATAWDATTNWALFLAGLALVALAALPGRE